MGSSQSEFMGPSGSTRLSAEAAHSMRAAWAALIASDHSHSIINRSRRSAWLKGLAVINTSLTVAFTVARPQLCLLWEKDRFTRQQHPT